MDRLNEQNVIGDFEKLAISGTSKAKATNDWVPAWETAAGIQGGFTRGSPYQFKTGNGS